jgi:hypothetical protein
MGVESRLRVWIFEDFHSRRLSVLSIQQASSSALKTNNKKGKELAAFSRFKAQDDKAVAENVWGIPASFIPIARSIQSLCLGFSTPVGSRS